ncbi:MAG: hypothetical protein M1822_001790 [Bathelium mastoideum]|nr:MAG: hypothetical protein M1822_001790 [Bathelium mastoideum]
MNPDIDHDYESLLNDVSRQMASSQLSRRNSRSSKRHSGSTCRRSIRIEKPPTAHNSPRILERRRTTSSVKQYASLDDHFNAMFGAPESEDWTMSNDSDKNAVRPFSWHPSGSNAGRTRARNDSSNQHSVNVSDIPRTYATSNHSFEQTLPEEKHTFEDDAAMNMMSQADGGDLSAALWHRYAQTSTWPLMAHADPHYVNNLAYFGNPQDWGFAASSSPQPSESVTTQPASEMCNDYLPIQNPHLSPNVMHPTLRPQRSKDSSKSLVGMGLYDPPDSISDSWPSHANGCQSWLAPDLIESRGKGLKLEETFEPPPDHDEDGGEEDDNGSSEDEVQDESPVVEEPHLHVTVASNQPNSLAGQSFFFDDDDAYSNDYWWTGQTKNVAAPDATALNYGWI